MASLEGGGRWCAECGLRVEDESGWLTTEAKDALLTRVRAAAAAGKFKPAESQRVEALEPQVRVVLEALGHPEAYVTDRSMVADFSLELEEQEALSARASEVLGVAVSPDDYLWQVAERLLGPGDVS